MFWIVVQRYVVTDFIPVQYLHTLFSKYQCIFSYWFKYLDRNKGESDPLEMMGPYDLLELI